MVSSEPGISIDKCFECNECCWNEKPTLKVIFTAEELDAVKVSGFTPMPSYQPLPTDGTVFSIANKVIEDGGHIRYTCPFYDNSGHRCVIYPIRPFDCRTWPFFFAHGEDCHEVFLNCYDHYCRAIGSENIHDPRPRLNLTSSQTINLLKRHPGLIWDYSNAQSFLVIENITGLLQF